MSGIYGSSPIMTRPLDTFGIGYTFTRYSSPVAKLRPGPLADRQRPGGRMFYNIAVTPWFNVAPDLQVVFPAREETLPPNRQSIDTSLVLGLRAKINF